MAVVANDGREGRNQGFLQISIKASERENLTLGDVTTFLYEFNLLYEISRLVVDPQYENYSITQVTSSRVVDRLLDDDKLHLENLSINSPLDLNLILNASGVALAAITAVLTGLGLRGNGVKERRNEILFERDVAGSAKPDNQEVVQIDSGIELRLPPIDGDFKEKLEIRKATKHYNREQQRLTKSPITVEEVTIRYSREMSTKHK